MDGFDVIPEDLHTAASNIGEAVGKIGESFVRDVGGGSDYGHDGLHGALTAFLSTAHGHVEGCQRDAGMAGQALRADSGTYTGTDGRNAGVFGGQ